MQTKIDKKSKKNDIFYVLKVKGPKNNGKIPQGLKAVPRKEGFGEVCVGYNLYNIYNGIFTATDTLSGIDTSGIVEELNQQQKNKWRGKK